MAYRVHTTHSGTVPTILCKACKDNPPIKSNASIISEIRRLVTCTGLWHLSETVCCRNPDCENHDKPIANFPGAYRKQGKQPNGAQIVACKSCGRRNTLSKPLRISKNSQRLAVDVFSLIANKSPVRGTVRGAELPSTRSYYSLLDFIYRRCLEYSGSVDRALIDGRLQLPADLNVQSDAREYTLNWVSRLDRRNVVLSSYCTVDATSRFVLGLHVNHDSAVEPFAINAEAAQNGDMETKEPFRRFAHYWLAGDELKSGRSMGRRIGETRPELSLKIQALYRAAAERANVEDIELQFMDKVFRTLMLRNGMQVHLPYVAYAHWFLLHRMLTGAGVQQLQLNTDINSMTRAAFLCAFSEKVKQHRAHGFFVRYEKHHTVDKRNIILKESKAARNAFQLTLAEEDRPHVVCHMMQHNLDHHGKVYGKWKDLWYEHPKPTMNEPRKAMSWLTSDPAIDKELKLDMYLRAGMSTIDNVFQMTRRLVNTFERPQGTSSSQNTVWYGYAPI